MLSRNRLRYALVRHADRVASRALWVSVATLAEAEALAGSIPLTTWDREGWDIMREDSRGCLYAFTADSFEKTLACGCANHDGGPYAPECAS